jgi:ketosteroid isomerase-like protein
MVVAGRANIQTAFSRFINAGITKLEIETVEIFGTQDLLAEEGRVTIYVKDKVIANEKTIILWKIEEGKWKLFRDIANSNTN